MDASQHAEVAAAFLDKLHQDDATYHEWNAMDKSDHAAMAQYVGKTLNLAQAPTAEDMPKLAQHAQTHLQNKISAIQEKHADAPTFQGFMAMTQQDQES